MTSASSSRRCRAMAKAIKQRQPRGAERGNHVPGAELMAGYAAKAGRAPKREILNCQRASVGAARCPPDHFRNNRGAPHGSMPE
jgi:hypothetical protein